MKCADCDCLPEECKISTSAKLCPNCTWDECCCWDSDLWGSTSYRTRISLD